MFNAILAYFLALLIQCLMVRYDKHFWVDRHTDTEKGDQQNARKVHAKSFCEGSPIGSSIGIDSSGESSEGDEPTPQPSTAPNSPEPTTSLRSQLLSFTLQHPLLLLTWLLTLTVGLPLRYATQADVPLSTFLLFAIWLTTLTIQSTIKTTTYPLPRRLRTLLTGLSNSVLWTALAMTAYVFADATLSNRPLPTMLATLQTNTPLSTLLVRTATSSPPTTPNNPTPLSSNTSGRNNPPTTAGDLALTLLNSSLVTWGLTLASHRSTLLSRAGLTTCTVSSLLALFNLLCGPAFAHAALGVGPGARAVAFAARSVTIALAGPVMNALGGDGGLNAAMVVGSGIVWQMGMGLGVGGWVEGRVLEGGWWGLRTRLKGEEGGTGTGGNGGGGGDTGVGARTETTRVGGEHNAEMAVVAVRQRANDPRTVAAGVTVGVNAAAMGTAYLYEGQSEAAPHAALSMVALGIMTVVFSSIPPLARWVMRSVGA
jgi:putative effector of murein hydrolase